MSGREVREVMMNEVIPLLYHEIKNVVLGYENDENKQPVSAKTL